MSEQPSWPARRHRVVIPKVGAMKCDLADARRIARETGGWVEESTAELFADGQLLQGRWRELK